MTADQKTVYVQIYKAAYAADKQYMKTNLEWMHPSELRRFILNQETTYVLNHDHLESLARQVEWDSRGKIS